MTYFASHFNSGDEQIKDCAGAFRGRETEKEQSCRNTARTQWGLDNY